MKSLPRENHPSIQFGSTFIASRAGLDARGIKYFFDCVAEAGFIFDQETRKAHAIGLRFRASRVVYLLFTFRHGAMPPMFLRNVDNAAEAFKRGGVMTRRLPESPLVTANLICAALALRNSDHSSAMAPVTKGAAALVPPIT